VAASRDRDFTNETKEVAADLGKVASAASANIGADLAALRNDMARLGAQLAQVLTERGSVVWRKSKSNVEGAIAETRDKSIHAVGAMREAGDQLIDAFDNSFRKRPYTTLMIAGAIGFLMGATWRRQ